MISSCPRRSGMASLTSGHLQGNTALDPKRMPKGCVCDVVASMTCFFLCTHWYHVSRVSCAVSIVHAYFFDLSTSGANIDTSSSPLNARVVK